MKLLEIALKEYGVKEIAGEKDNQRIVNYAKESGFEWVDDDETPWCSIFMNWVVKRAGLLPTKKANARSWLEWGEPVMFPEMGDIVVFKRGSSQWQGHVALYINEQGDYVNVLGGNQSDQVKISAYKKEDILGFRTIS